MSRGGMRAVVLTGCVACLGLLSWRLVADRLEYRAEDALWEGDVALAITRFEQARRWDPLDPEPRIGRADALFDRAEDQELGADGAIRDLENAIDGYRDALHLAPDDAYAWSQLGRAYGSLAVARRASEDIDLSRLLAAGPPPMSREDQIAALAMTRAVDLEPNNYDFINFFAHFLDARGDPRALDWYRRGARTLPRLLKHPYLESKNLPDEIADAAVAGAREAVATESVVPDTEILEEIAVFLARRGDVRGAIAANAEAINLYESRRFIHPHLPWIWTRQGNWLKSVGDREAAREAFETALELDPGRASAHFALGRLAAEDGDWVEAVKHFRAARNQVPGNLRFQMELARTLEESGDLEGAVREYERALKLEGGAIPASMALVDLHRRQGAYDEAIRHARRLVELEPDEPAFARQLAELNARLQF
ncbi:MAG: tetratricopeptide repeat protein [Acidobacteriota bacterium]|jgi:tetratricopeptide (TPR) repeat protein